MPKKNILVFLGPVFIIIGIQLIMTVLTNQTGELSGLLKYVGGALAILSFLSPKLGMVFLSIYCFYGDYLKKLAVYYGEANILTVMEVLAVGMAILGSILAGAFVKCILRGPKPDKITLMLTLITLLFTGMIFASGDTITDRIQAAVNGGLYFGVAPLICWLYKDREEAMGICRLHFFLGVPSVIVAIYQYFNGFTFMDWWYAYTGLSPVYSSQMLSAETPRVFGLFGSSSAFGVLPYLFTFGLWQISQKNVNKLIYFLGIIIYGIGLVVSTQRTILMLPLLTFIVYLVFRDPKRTLFLYLGLAFTMLSAILLSDQILAALPETEANLDSVRKGEWSDKVLRVGSISDRLKGWTRLKNSNSYTLFGVSRKTSADQISFQDDDYAHDSMNSILINYGIFGLLVFLSMTIWLLKSLHQSIWRIRVEDDKRWANLIMAIIVVNGSLTLMMGDNLHTVPINLVLFTLVGVAANAMRRGSEPEIIQEPGLEKPELIKMALGTH